jgi:hypothetical protein
LYDHSTIAHNRPFMATRPIACVLAIPPGQVKPLPREYAAPRVNRLIAEHERAAARPCPSVRSPCESYLSANKEKRNREFIQRLDEAKEFRKLGDQDNRRRFKCWPPDMACAAEAFVDAVR